MSQGTRRAWKLQEFPAHAANVNSVSLGRKSGRVLVTGGGDKKVNLWAVGKPNCIMSLSGHSTPVDCVQFSITEEQVVAGSAAGALKIWDLESAKMLRTLTGHRASIRSVDFHPYGDFLASGSSDSGIKLWDIRKKGCIFGYKGHNGTVNSLKFSPDGQWIASGGDDNLLKVWDIRVGKVLTEFADHRGPVTDVEFHPHEFLLASGSLDRTVKFYELETFSLISSTMADVPPVKCIAFHPSGACLFSASSETLRVHGWEPPEAHDSVATTWSKIQDIAISHEQLVGVTMQMTNVSIFVVDLRRVHPIGNPNQLRAALSSAGHTLRKNFNKERSSEFVESLNAMKATEDSDSLPTDPEDELNVPLPFIGTNFKEAFRPHRDLARTPPPEEFYPPPDNDSPISTSTNGSSSPRADPGNGRSNNKFRFVTRRENRSNETSPRRGSVPNFVPGQPAQNQLNPSTVISSRSRSPEYLSSRQSSLSDESSGPHSGRSTETNNSSYTESFNSNAGYNARREQLKSSHSESCLQLPSSGNIPQQQQHLPQIRDRNHHQGSTQSTPVSLQPLARSPEKPLAQCQVKPMPKVSPREFTSNIDYEKKTDYCKSQIDDFVPIPMDKPAGLAINDFLPKSSMTMKGGVAVPMVNETEIFSTLLQEHQPFVSVLVNRQRNLRIIYNIWQTKDAKAAVETALSLNDQSVLVDLLTVLSHRPATWTLDLCVAMLPCISQLIQNRFESHIDVGCSALKLILKNFGNVIKSNIQGPIQTVGVDISREERYNKSMECYRQLVTIRAFTLKRQTVPGKVGHTFRELHILLENLD